MDVKKVNWKGTKITENGIDYVLNKETGDVYDFNSYERALELGTELLKIGKLVTKDGKPMIDRDL